MNKYTPQTFKSDILREEYRKYTHPCGLDIYVYPKKMSATYAIFGTKYGSIHNTFRPQGSDEWITVPDGIAHFLEHKLFFNEDGSDSFERFSEYGADANAYTSFNKTAYLFSCTGALDKSLGELIDFVTHPYFTDASVASEVGIISEEIKMYEDNPGDRCFYGMLKGLYSDHSIRRNICGDTESIRRVSAKTLYDCYNAFYTPSNMALIVCGDVRDEDILAIADAHLPSAPYGITVERANENDKESPTAHKAYVENKMPVAKPLFSIGFKDTDIPASAEQRTKKDITNSILDEMIFARAGKLYDSLFERGLISPAFSYGYTISREFAYHSVAGEADDPRLVLDEIFAYLDLLRTNGLDESDFLRAKRVMYAEAVKAFDSTENIANSLFSYVCEDSEILSSQDIIASVTFSDVCNAFECAFNKDSVTLSVVIPNNKENEVE